MRNKKYLDSFIPWEHEWRAGVCWGPIDLSRCIAEALVAYCTWKGIRRVVTYDSEMFYYRRATLLIRYEKGKKDWTKVWTRFMRWEKGLKYAAATGPGTSPRRAGGGKEVKGGAVVRRPPSGGGAS